MIENLAVGDRTHIDGPDSPMVTVAAVSPDGRTVEVEFIAADDPHLARYPDGTLDTEPACLCASRLSEYMACPRHWWGPIVGPSSAFVHIDSI